MRNACGCARRLFPRLFADGYEKNSRESSSYNCIAFAAGDVEHIWDGFGDPPDGYWPTTDTGTMVGHLVSAYKAERFEECDGAEPEKGYEKVVLYRNAKGKWTHAAHLRLDGWWESKLGQLDDIIHRSPQGLVGTEYGEVACFMKRRVSDRLRFHLVLTFTTGLAR
jgi:hypothetical protein